MATEKHDQPAPVNLGAGMEIKIKDLVDLIVELMGFEGTIVCDSSQPDGQPRRWCLNVSGAQREFGFPDTTADSAADGGLSEAFLENLKPEFTR